MTYFGAHGLPLSVSVLRPLPFECAKPTYPIAFGSFATALATRPSEVTGFTFEDCVLPLRTALWKNV